MESPPISSDSPPISPPMPRRRSSFMRRSSVGLVEQPVEASDDREEYMKKLERECAEWEKLYRRKKNELVQAKSEAAESNHRDDETYLMTRIPEEIATILRQDEEDLERIRRDCAKLDELCDFAEDYYGECLGRSARIADRAETIARTITRAVLDKSSIDDIQL